MNETKAQANHFIELHLALCEIERAKDPEMTGCFGDCYYRDHCPRCNSMFCKLDQEKCHDCDFDVRRLNELYEQGHWLWQTMVGKVDLVNNMGGDVRMYWTGGMWVHPCGAIYQEAGRDGFEESCGAHQCECDLCKEIRDLLREDSHPIRNCENAKDEL